MKRALFLLLTFVFLFSFSGCSVRDESPEEKAGEIRTFYSEKTDFELAMDITADYGDHIAGFSIDYSGTDSFGKAEIKAPAELAGMTVTYSDGGTVATFDGAELYMGKLTEDGLSPIGFIPAAVSCWKKGFISQCVYESIENCDTILIISPLSETSDMATWFDLTTMLPLRAEITSGGRAVISCVFDRTEIS